MKIFKVLCVVFVLGLVGCAEKDYSKSLPYMVTKIGKKVELTYVGVEPIPDYRRTISKGSFYQNNKWYECNLHTLRFKEAKTEDYTPCSKTSVTSLGRMYYFEAHEFRQDHSSILNHGYLTAGTLPERDPELLLKSAEMAMKNSTTGILSERVTDLEGSVEYIEKSVQEVDEKVEKNLSDTVEAMRKVNNKINNTSSNLAETATQVLNNTQDLVELNKLKDEYKNLDKNPEENLIKETSKVIIKPSEDNPFGFIE